MSRVDDRRDKKDWVRREQLALLKLTDQQRKLCESYIRNMDKAVAMTEAGYWVPKTRGPKQLKFIEMNFERYISPPDVQRYLLLLKESVASRLGISMDDIIDEFRAMAFTNMSDFVDWNNDGVTFLKSSKDLTRMQKAGIAEITETTTKAGKIVKIKLHNKQTALDRLFEILRDLEKTDSEEEGPAKISQTQINILLSDPVKRRAIEHLAESLFDRQISLVGTDKQRLEFEERMQKITRRLLEVTDGNGAAGHGSVAGALPEETETIGGEGADRGDRGDENQEPDGAELRHGEEESEAQGGEEGQVPGELEAGRRYDIDGL